MKRIFLSALLCSATLFAAEPMFPFVVSYEPSKNATNVAHLNKVPAGKDGFIRILGEQFVDNSGEMRFWATNLSGGANFPTHEMSERIAARLAKFGYNCVRLHWMDAWDIYGGWDRKNHTDFDPDRIDRLEYLIYCLKKHGIYVNVNLHVSRQLDDRDGFPNKEQRPEYDKGVGNFYPAMIEKQKEYAKMLLTHVSPYTKLPLTDDPCVSMIEISNEDSIFLEWSGVWGRTHIDTLPEPYAADLRRQWNDWLKKKYKSTEELVKAWDVINEPLGTEIITNGDFNAPFVIDGNNWYPEVGMKSPQADKESPQRRAFTKQAEQPSIPTSVYWQTDNIVDCDANVQDGILKMRVRKMGGVDWVPQLIFRHFKIEKGKPYILSFKMKADKPAQLNIGVNMDRDPWSGLGVGTSIDLTTDWKTFSYQFLGAATEDKARFHIGGHKIGEYELDDLSLRPGGNFGFPIECKLENGTIPIVKRKDAKLLANATHDWVEFIVDLERKYWIGMYRFLKDELKVKQPVSGTQLAYGSSHVQSETDYCDDHAYWNHPEWTAKAWDSKNWFVRNRSLANYADKEILPNLATRRISGKPYTVSEYNHPFPNQFLGEGLPMLAAFGRFQNWNGFFQYTYAHKIESDPDKVVGFFDMISNALQLAHSPACAVIFRTNVVKPAQNSVVVQLGAKQEIDLMADKLSPYFLGFSGLGYDPKIALLNATAVKIVPQEQSPPFNMMIPSVRKYTSDTGELHWDMSQEGAGFFTLNAPKAKIFSGFVKDRIFDVGDVNLKIGKTLLDFATISLVQLDGSPKRYLLTATGTMHNKNGVPRKLEKEQAWRPDDMFTLSDQWGDSPVLCEGIPFELAFAGAKKIHVWPLDEAGNRKTEKPLVFPDGKATLGPEFKTIWYEIELP